MFIEAEGYFTQEPKEKFSGYVICIAPAEKQKEVQESEKDRKVFFYLTPEEPVLGDHGDFVVTSFREVWL